MRKSMILVMLLCIAIVSLSAPVQATTTEVDVVKYASDDTTTLDTTTVNYMWMEVNLPVERDGVTHCYQQGPVFEGDSWDPDETANLKDKGAVKGTDVRDLCDLVKGMSADDEIKITASDRFSKCRLRERLFAATETGSDGSLPVQRWGSRP